MMSLRTFVIIAQVLVIVLQISDALRCKKTAQDNPDCPFTFYQSTSSSCSLASFTSLGFIFYVFPSHGFEKLTMYLKKEAFSFMPTGSLSFEIGKNLLPLPDKWYMIQFISESTRSFSLYVDGVRVWGKSLLVSKGSSVNFKLQGSLFYGSQCKPTSIAEMGNLSDSLVPHTPSSLKLTDTSSETQNFDNPTDNTLVNLVIIMSASALALIIVGTVVAFLLLRIIRKRNDTIDGARYGNNTEDKITSANESHVDNDYRYVSVPSSPNVGYLIPKGESSMNINKATSNLAEEEPIYEVVESIYEEVDEAIKGKHFYTK